MSLALPLPLSSEPSTAAFDDRGLRRRLRARGCVAPRRRAPDPAHFRSHLAYARTPGDGDNAQRKRSFV